MGICTPLDFSITKSEYVNKNTMKKIFFISLLFLATCTQDKEPNPVQNNYIIHQPDNPKAPAIRTPSNGIDPGCHGDEWFETVNFASISPWQYLEPATIVIKAQVTQLGYGGMGPVQIKYKLKNISGSNKRMHFTPNAGGSGGLVLTGNNHPYLAPGQSVLLTLTIANCQPFDADGWFEYPFTLMVEYAGGNPQGQVSGEIFSVTGLSCSNTPNYWCTEHIKANHDQGFVWSINY
jgi:hypothetical protein